MKIMQHDFMSYIHCITMKMPGDTTRWGNPADRVEQLGRPAGQGRDRRCMVHSGHHRARNRADHAPSQPRPINPGKLTLFCAASTVALLLGSQAPLFDGPGALGLIVPWLAVLGLHLLAGPAALYAWKRGRRLANLPIYFVDPEKLLKRHVRHRHCTV